MKKDPMVAAVRAAHSYGFSIGSWVGAGMFWRHALDTGALTGVAWGLTALSFSAFVLFLWQDSR